MAVLEIDHMLTPPLPAPFRREAEHGRRALRMMHSYCVGAGKTGTHSVAGMFKKHFLAAHEPASQDLVPWILRFKKGKLSKRTMLAFLRKRDSELCLDMESNGTLAAVQDLLVECFPEAKFILTIRDCYSWLNSVVNHNISRKPSKLWDSFDSMKYGSATLAHPPQEKVLAALGLRCVDDYLQHWAAHIDDIVRITPTDRLLVLRTDELNCSAEKLANFLGINAELIDISQSHLHRNPQRFGLLEEIGLDYIEDKAKKHCVRWMETFFPDISNAEAALDAGKL